MELAAIEIAATRLPLSPDEKSRVQAVQVRMHDLRRKAFQPTPVTREENDLAGQRLAAILEEADVALKNILGEGRLAEFRKIEDEEMARFLASGSAGPTKQIPDGSPTITLHPRR